MLGLGFGGALTPPPSHAVAAPHSPPVIDMGGKGMAVADDEGNFLVGEVT